ncbi:helicase-associated domain-containing protein [Paenibacillus algorifonticola]|uniref:helicase-associated domain-containing protein n=1 Tax=Paenibacillus algorifonticola TaxID=684063 RepID=UPI003D2DDF8E
MYVHELADKLTDYRQQTFMEAPMWWYAAKENKQWSDAVKDRRSMLEAIQSLSSTTLAALKAIIKLAGADPAPEERLFRLGPKQARMSGAEFRWALAELQRGGLVFSVSRNWGERVYFMPRDSFALWQQLLFPYHLEPKAMDALAEEEVQFQASGRLLGLQLLDAWTELARSGLTLTNKGILPKKIIARLGISVTLTEENIACLNVSDDRIRQYGRIPAFILETAIRLGVLEEEEGRLLWVKDKLEQWLILNSFAREAYLHSLIVEHYLYRKPLLAHGASTLSVLTMGPWYEAEAWLQHVQGEAVATAAGQLALSDKQQLLGWLDTLQAFGWLERIEWPGERSWFRWMMDPQHGTDRSSAPLSSEREAVIVQPNGEIIVLPECDGRIRWELELMAERVNEEQQGLYRLSRKSIERAIAFGRTEAAMLAFLEWASGSQDAAAEAALLLRDWGSRLGQLGKPVPGVGNIGKGRDYPSFQGSSQQQPAAGFRLYPDSGMAAPKAGPEDWLGHYELIQHDEENKQGSYAGLKQIPASWLSQRRAYHHSTSREMMERALQWQTPVELHLEEGLAVFVPWELHAESNSWSVTGSFSGAQYGASVRLSPESWQAMRLLVPGINFHT